MHKVRVWVSRYLQLRLAFGLYRLRRRAGLGRRASAEMLQLTSRDLLLIELGIKSIRMSLIPKMLAAYNVAPSAIYSLLPIQLCLYPLRLNRPL